MDIRYEEPLYVDEISLKAVKDLGRGCYGTVSLMVHPSTQVYAKKTSSMHLKENLKKELRTMLFFRNHPRIVQPLSDRLHLSMLLKDCYIYMEYASQGTLDEKISSNHGQPLPENVIGRTTRMILEGLEELHSKGYVHCDIKPDNILLFPSTTLGDPWDVKIGDFGLSKEPTDSTVLYAGVNRYMPPISAADPRRKVQKALDIWSLGCVVYEMFGGKPERMGDSYVWKLDQDISPVTKDFLNRCHAWDPSDRASAAELLNHAFIKQRVFSVPRPIPTPPPPPPTRTQRPLFTQRAPRPLPTPIGPVRRQQEAALTVPEAQSSVQLEDQSTVEKNNDDNESVFIQYKLFR